MTKNLEQDDRDILTFRPDIVFVEPEGQEGEITPIQDPIPFEDIQNERQRLRQFAKAVNTMAAAIQARADQRAKNLVIKLDPNADADAIQAMLRRFPGAPRDEITYEQYRQVREDIRRKGEAVGRQAIIQPQEVQQARDSLNTYVPGGYGTTLANTGGLRPELDTRAQIIPPINIEELQIDLICILLNFIWKNFIKPFIINAGGPIVGTAFRALPDQLCDPGGGIEIPGLFILGNNVPDLLTGKVARQAAQAAGI